ncbi:MAG: hypothetical protein AAF828_09625 [Bacteroidota bacterium]
MSGRERERLRQFVASPYFNQHERTVKLLAIILEELEAKRPLLSKARVFKKLFPKKEYREQPLSDVMSALMKLINRFLAVEQLEKEPFVAEVLTLRRAESENRFDLLKNRGKRLMRLLEKYPHQGSDYHWADFKLHAIYGYYRNAYEDRSDAAPLQQMLYSLDRYYAVEKLRHACHLTANTMLMNTSFDFGFLDAVLSYIKSDPGQEAFANDKSIDCYYHMLMSMREPDEPRHYEKVRYYLNEAFDSFPLNEQRDIFTFANNYCITRIMKGDAEYRRELFELYRRGLDNEIIYDNGIISEWNYKNIVTLGCNAKEYEWTEQFIETNYARLPENQRDNAYAMNKAQYFYSRGLYQEAGDLLRQVEDSDVKYHLARVLLEVRIAYDQEETNYLLNILETFRLYVRRHRKMSANDKKQYINYARLAKQLATLRHQEAYMGKEQFTQKLTALHTKIKDTQQVVAREWLITESRPQAMTV